MFENHFGFIRRPFTAAPDVELFVANEATQRAKESIEYCLRSGQGISVLTASTGTGKTMLCQVLNSSLGSEFQISFLPSPGTSSCLGLLQAIYFGLGQRVKKKHAGITDSEMRLELLETVREMRLQTTGIVVIVDEAHLLSAQQLEEIRVLSSYHDRGQPLVRPLLCGTPEFEERLLDPSLRAFNQRIRCQAYLSPLTRAESERFLQEQLARAGVRNRRVFDIEAVAAIVAASEGNPRCLNQLCDHSLYLAARAEEPTVTASVVSLALDELMQLPLEYSRPLSSDMAPSATGTTETTDESVLEFGSLDDDSVQSAGAGIERSLELGDTLDSERDLPVCELKGSVGVVEIGTLDEEEDIVSISASDGDDGTSASVHEPDVSSEAATTDQNAGDTYRVQGREERGEELEASFRQGLPDAPVLAEDVVVAEVVQGEDVVPAFDAPVVSEDLIAAGIAPIVVQAAGEDATAVRDAWLDAATVPSVEQGDYISLEEADQEPDVVTPLSSPIADEEDLVRSCVDTRKEIASMLDSLESHVSESLSQQYDVVMPEDAPEKPFRIAEIEAESDHDELRTDTVSAAELRLGDRLTRVVRQQQGLL